MNDDDAVTALAALVDSKKVGAADAAVEWINSGAEVMLDASEDPHADAALAAIRALGAREMLAVVRDAADCAADHLTCLEHDARAGFAFETRTLAETPEGTSERIVKASALITQALALLGDQV